MRRLLAAVPIIGALLLLGSVLREDESVSAETGPCGTANDFITPAEAQMLTLVNNYRVAEFDVQPMTMSVSASKAAQWQAEALLTGQASGHTDIYGRIWNQRLADCGYDPYWARAGGESFANFQSASAAFDWMVNGGGAGHSGGVEAPVGYKCAGVGYASVGSSHMWVVVLAAYSISGPCPDPISVTLPPTVVPPTVATPTASPTATATIPAPTPTEVIYRSFAPALAGDD